ncbi:1275_t:CDS:2, partial [Diversispora eburnea]
RGKSEMEDVLIGPFDKESRELPLTRITKRRRIEEGREEQYSDEEEPLSTRKRKQDRILDYLKKINKEVEDLQNDSTISNMDEKETREIEEVIRREARIRDIEEVRREIRAKENEEK